MEECKIEDKRRFSAAIMGSIDLTFNLKAMLLMLENIKTLSLEHKTFKTLATLSGREGSDVPSVTPGNIG